MEPLNFVEESTITYKKRSMVVKSLVHNKTRWYSLPTFSAAAGYVHVSCALLQVSPSNLLMLSEPIHLRLRELENHASYVSAGGLFEIVTPHDTASKQSVYEFLCGGLCPYYREKVPLQPGELKTHLLTYGEVSDLEIPYVHNKFEIWFYSKPFATILRYVKYTNAVARHVRAVDRSHLSELLQRRVLNPTSNIDGLSEKSVFVSLSGLFQLVRRSRMPEPRPFRRWLRSTFLPSLFSDLAEVDGSDSDDDDDDDDDYDAYIATHVRQLPNEQRSTETEQIPTSTTAADDRKPCNGNVSSNITVDSSVFKQFFDMAREKSAAEREFRKAAIDYERRMFKLKLDLELRKAKRNRT